MVASLYSRHIVVLGVGRVGCRIIDGLVAISEPVVAVERNGASEFLEQIRELDVPVILGEGRQRKVLEQAGVARARAIILATDDDLANLDAALTARDINPGIRVVVRLFDETLAVKIGGAFDLAAVSTSHVSAPSFIAAATGRKVYHNFELGGKHLHLTDLTVHPAGKLVGQSVGDIQIAYDANVVMHKGQEAVSANPESAIILAAQDTILVIAPRDNLAQLERANRAGVAP